MIKHIRNLMAGALLAIVLGIPYLQAADVAISALPAGTTLAGTEAIPAVQSAATVKTTPAAIKTYVETGGTVTASDPVLDLSQTWNNNAVAFTGIRAAFTETATNAGSNYLSITRGAAGSTNALRVYLDAAGTNVDMVLGATQTITFTPRDAITGTARITGSSPFYITGTAGVVLDTSTTDVIVGSNVTDFRNSTTAQTLRVYDTYTDSSNYGRIALNTSLTGDWVQVAAETAGTAGDNYGIALTPSGIGAISAHVPDSTSAGGNARGNNAVDFQVARADVGATAVASGNNSFLGGGDSNSVAGGLAVVVGGYQNSASATESTVSGGRLNVASGTRSWIPGGHQASTRGLNSAYAYSAGARAAVGDAQVIGQPVRRTTTDATPVSLATDGTPAATTVMVVPDGAVMMCTSHVAAKPSASITDGVGFVIESLFYRSGSTTALLSTPVSTVHGTNALGLGATHVANDTLEAAEVQVTGAAATTIYWAGDTKCVQVL